MPGGVRVFLFHLSILVMKMIIRVEEMGSARVVDLTPLHNMSKGDPVYR